MSKFSLDTLVVYAELLGLRTEIKTTGAEEAGPHAGSGCGRTLRELSR